MTPSFDNLRRIAITNLRNNEKALETWWRRKYRVPPKSFEEYTLEELLIENFEDFYAQDPRRIDEFEEALMHGPEDHWDGSVPQEVEEVIKRLGKRNQGALAKYQTEGDEKASDEDIQRVVDSIGWNLPRSRQLAKARIPTEFDDSFMGD